MSQRTLTLGLTVLTALALIIGCSDSTTGPDGTYLTVSFRDTGAPPAAAKVDAVSAITLTSVQVVLGKIIFEGDSGDSAVFVSPEHAPLVLELDLTGREQRLGSISVPAGTFDRSLFRIERLEPTDSMAYANNPEMQGLSLRIAGYVNGSPDSSFVFTSELDEEQQRDFSTALDVTDGTYRIEFQFNHDSWFLDDGSAIIDPREAQIASSRSAVETNIVNDFDMYHP